MFPLHTTKQLNNQTMKLLVALTVQVKFNVRKHVRNDPFGCGTVIAIKIWLNNPSSLGLIESRSEQQLTLLLGVLLFLLPCLHSESRAGLGEQPNYSRLAA